MTKVNCIVNVLKQMVELNRLFKKDWGKTASAARILSPNPTRRPLPCLLIQSFFYAQCPPLAATLQNFSWPEFRSRPVLRQLWFFFLEAAPAPTPENKSKKVIYHKVCVNYEPKMEGGAETGERAGAGPKWRLRLQPNSPRLLLRNPARDTAPLALIKFSRSSVIYCTNYIREST